tara:strand:+ start:324 stop:539 length:216 start_codon:yes stop_codon:yes gene_type:complete
MSDDKINRPVHPSDFLAVFAGFVHNLAQSVEVLTSELYEMAIYNSNHRTRINSAWQEMAKDLENLQEESDG